MTQETVDIERARRVILDVIQLRATEQNAPWLFDDDVILFASARVGSEWFLSQIADRTLPLEGRKLVASLAHWFLDESLAILESETAHEEDLKGKPTQAT
jgi:hypothetical protein